MGNTCASQVSRRRNFINYGSTRGSNEDLTTLNRMSSTVSELNEFPTTKKRTIALTCMLVSQCFFNVAFFIISNWIPLSPLLDANFWVGRKDSHRYYGFMYRVQSVSVLAVVLLCSTGWIAGILMDTWFKKTKFVLGSLVLACIGFGFLVAIIAFMSQNIHCEPINTNGYSCNISHFALCLLNNPEDGYCLNVLIGWICTVSVLGSVSRTALPALGGDQIPERHGVKVFYAQFYWCQKVGEMISALICVLYLVHWSNLMFKEDVPLSVQNLKEDYLFLFIAWAVSISVACVISLLSLSVVVCGKLTREVNPDFGVLRDSFLMFVEACKRRSERQDDDQWLDTAKQSRGGSFADQAVEDRRQMAKFSLVLLLLVPIAFATTILTMPVMPSNTTAITPDQRLHESFHQSSTTVAINLSRYITVCIAIPAIHIIGNVLAKRGRPLTLLHRFILGHVTMLLALVTDLVIHVFVEEYSILSQIFQMILLGLCNAFIYTAGYELTLISAPRAMQCTAMGLFYLMDGVANIFCWIFILYLKPIDAVPGSKPRTLMTGVGGVALTFLSLLLLIFAEKKFRLGLHRV